ncbi:hypothetical protein D3C76_1826960 [compost metagenome]
MESAASFFTTVSLALVMPPVPVPSPEANLTTTSEVLLVLVLVTLVPDNRAVFDTVSLLLATTRDWYSRI